MKRQILHVSVIQSAKVLALMYFVMGIFFVVVMAFFSTFLPGPRHPLPFDMLLAMPFAYLVFGFILSVIGAWVYNMVAKWVGGVEFTVEDVE